MSSCGIHCPLSTRFAGRFVLLFALASPPALADELAAADHAAASADTAVPATIDDDAPPTRPPPPSESDAEIPRTIQRKSASERTAEDTSAAASAHRIQLFLIPVGDDVGPVTAPVQAGLEGETNKLTGYHPVDLVQELAPPTPPDVAKKVADARKLVEDGINQFIEHQFMTAVDRYKRAIDLLGEAVLGTTSTELAEVTTRQAVALKYAGEDDRAHDAFRAAARLDLSQAVDGAKIDPDVGKGLAAARKEIARASEATLTVVTTPAGSRVFVGGVYRGTSPVTVEHLPVGEQVVRIDRPGADVIAKLVDVKAADGTLLRLKMSFAKETVDLQNKLQQLPLVLDRERGIPAVGKELATRFKLERMIVATVSRITKDRAEVRAVVFDIPKDARLADEHAVFASDPASLRTQVAKWAHGVFARADGKQAGAASDPLRSNDGTEDWYANKYQPGHTEPPAATPDPAANPPVAAAADAPVSDDPPPKPAKAKSSKPKKKTIDPLDAVDGTEDW